MEYSQFGHSIRIAPDRIEIRRRHVLGRGVLTAVLGLVGFVLALQVLLALMGVTMATDAPGHAAFVAVLIGALGFVCALFVLTFRSLRREQARGDDDALMVWIDRAAGLVRLPDGTPLGPVAEATQYQHMDLTNSLQGIVYRMFLVSGGQRFHIYTSGVRADREAIAAALGIPKRP